jgi:uncharacterized C2H2 Zn-finger protein
MPSMGPWARLAGMTGLTLRCPRCKQGFSDDDADQLADALVAHVEQEHGHAPPREHVVARIKQQNTVD